MNKILFLCLATALPVRTHASDYQAMLDLSEIVVTASRTPQSTQTVTGDITVIDREQIDRVSGGAIVDLLRLQPGLQITTNGGMGNASNVFMRGTNTNQLVVLIDGVRMNSATTGTTAFENLPLALIDRIEILRGPASSLYGADAIGGVIQIFTRRSQADNIRFFGSLGAGSYDTYAATAGFNAGYQALKFGAQMSSLDTRGISAKKSTASAVDHDRDGYNNLAGSSYASLTLAEGHSIDLNFIESNGKNHYDSGYHNYTTMHQQSYSVSLNNQLHRLWHSTLKYGTGIDRSFDYGSPSSVSRFDTEQNQLTWQHDFTLPVGTITVAYDRLEQTVETSKNGIPSIDRQRNNDSVTLGYTGQYDSHSVQASLREDHNTQYGSFVTGGLGYGYVLSPAWRVAAQYGSAFRAPTFNQLYFANFGDPSLAPEKSDNIEASVRYQNSVLQAKLTAFDNHIRDLIEFSGPVTSGCNRNGQCPVNIGKVEIQGVTAEGTYVIYPQWQLSGNLTVQSPRNAATDKLLARRSQRYGTLVLQYRASDWDWSTELTTSSQRYDNAANTVYLRGYMLLNTTLAYKLNRDWRLQARANNLLNKDYELVNGYNTMGTNLFISLNYQPQ